MANITVASDIDNFLQAADYAAARALLQDTAPYYGLICSKTNIDAQVGANHYGTFATGVTVANATPLVYLFKHVSGACVEARLQCLLEFSIAGFANLDLSSLDANRLYYVPLGTNGAANYKPVTGSNGFGLQISTPNTGAAVFSFYVFGIIEP